GGRTEARGGAQAGEQDALPGAELHAHAQGARLVLAPPDQQHASRLLADIGLAVELDLEPRTLEDRRPVQGYGRDTGDIQQRQIERLSRVEPEELLAVEDLGGDLGLAAHAQDAVVHALDAERTRGSL